MSDNANKGGRKRIPIDQKVFENLCSIQCTLAEIAAVIGCSEDTIERWCVRTYKEGFAETYKKKSQKGKASLRRLQFKHAETNPTMAIWLGKQWLGQRCVTRWRSRHPGRSRLLTISQTRKQKSRKTKWKYSRQQG